MDKLVPSKPHCPNCKSKECALVLDVANWVIIFTTVGLQPILEIKIMLSRREIIREKSNPNICSHLTLSKELVERFKSIMTKGTIIGLGNTPLSKSLKGE